MAAGFAELLAPAAVEALLHLPGTVVVDASYRLGDPAWGREAFGAGHLPGARFVGVDGELAEPPVTSPDARPGTHPGGRHPRPSVVRLGRTTRRLGIDDASTVVVTDQRSSLSAAWLAWLLRDAGFTGRVVVLDGGMAAWRRAGLPTATDLLPDGAGTFVPRPGHLPVLAADDVEAHLASGRRLVDVRAAERFAGRSEPVDPVAGHVPGATNLPATTLQADDGTFLPPDALARALDGLAPGDALMCGSGLTASQVLLAAASTGLDGMVLHAGSWSDWISGPTRPVAADSAAG